MIRRILILFVALGLPLSALPAKAPAKLKSRTVTPSRPVSEGWRMPSPLMSFQTMPETDPAVATAA